MSPVSRLLSLPWKLFLPAWLLLAYAPLLSAQTVPEPHAHADLIAEDKWVQPGRDSRVGLRFVLEKGWHIYWVNPGDSGEPPKVKWSLPAGFDAGPIEWPYPERLQNSTIVDHGYHDQVLLLARIHVPATTATAAPVRLAAAVKWLVCREICIPEKADLSLALPVENTKPRRDESVAALFAASRARLARSMPKAWRSSAVSEKDAFVLSLRTGKPESRALFFPLEVGQIENAAPQEAHPSSTGIRIRLAKSSQLLKPLMRLRGVVVFADGKAYRVDAPVKAP